MPQAIKKIKGYPPRLFPRAGFFCSHSALRGLPSGSTPEKLIAQATCRAVLYQPINAFTGNKEFFLGKLVSLQEVRKILACCGETKLFERRFLMIFTSPSVLLILALAFVFQIAILLFARSKGIAIGRISTWGSPSKSEGEEVRDSYIRSGIIQPAEHDSE